MTGDLLTDGIFRVKTFKLFNNKLSPGKMDYKKWKKILSNHSIKLEKDLVVGLSALQSGLRWSSANQNQTAFGSANPHLRHTWQENY